MSDALAKMIEMIDTYNQKQLFPFTLSLSYGIAIGKEGITPEQARTQADANMYIFKQQHHRAR
jgi:GGDEF domain-containing protein